MSFVMFWAVLDFIFLLSALGVMLERQQLRQEPRVPHQEPISLSSDVTKPIYGTTINASNAGVRLLLECDESQFSRLSLNEFATLEFHQTKATLHAKVVSSRRISNNSIELGMLYKLSTVEDERNAISVAFGSSKQLAINNKNRHQGRSIANGLINMGRFGLRDGTEHVRFLITMLFKRFKNL